MTEQMVVEPRFCGPDGIGNGGYVCGRVAAFIGGAAEVTLRKPAPLGEPLSVARPGDGRVSILHGGELIAEAAAAPDEDFSVPDAPALAAAQDASTRYVGHVHTNYPNCFVCGPNRTDDGMRIFAGPIDGGGGILASPWRPDAGFGDESGAVRPEFVWSALDCPGGFAINDDLDAMILLGRMSARQFAPVIVGEEHIVIGWAMGGEGRKRISGTAVYSAAGELRASARSIWILPRA
ncbi:MAG: hypothetical protein IH905_09100 [Proteobacteria bacterium]|nr:hypothetical protein [Pseudomonadota bacterium]